MNFNQFQRYSQGLVILSNKIHVSEKHAESVGWGPELVSATLEIVQIMEELNIDETEFSALASIVLSYPGYYRFNKAGYMANK